MSTTDDKRPVPEPNDAPTDAGSFGDSLKKVITVTLVAAISAGVLGLVYSQTKDRIEQSRRAELERALGYILPDFDNAPLDTVKPVNLDGSKCPVNLFTAKQGGQVTGYALQSCTTKGFGPRIDLLVGATPDGIVTGVYILTHQETPGLGAKATDGQASWGEWRKQCNLAKGGCSGNAPFLRQLANRKLGDYDFRVTKDGGKVDAITASTITSRAVSESVADSLKLITAEASGNTGGKGGAE